MPNQEKRLAGLRLILFDLDGTLLRNDGTIGSRTRKLVQQLRTLGVRFSLASGRHYHAMIDHARDLTVDLPLICLDGALVIDPLRQVPLYCRQLPPGKVRFVCDFASRHLLDVALSCPDAIYCLPHHMIMARLMDKICARYREADTYGTMPDTVLEIYLAGENYEVIKTVERRMAFPRAFGLTTFFYPAPRQEGIYCLEIRKNGSNKANGLRRLLRHSGIPMSRTAVTGDWHNDRQLFETTALKVAVGNATRSIRRRADLVLERSNDDEGLADFLEMVLAAKHSHKA